MHLKKLLPKNKSDIESIMKLKQYPFDYIKPISKELLSWLQDMNWPIANPLADYLEPHVNQLTDEILEIFRSRDEMWKYWIIAVFFLNAKYKANDILKKELHRMRDFPSAGEAENEINNLAKEALEHIDSML